MNHQLFSNQVLSQHLYTGPLVPHLDAFAAVLFEQGYSRLTIKVKIRVIAKFSRWLQTRHILIEDIKKSCFNKFIRYRIKNNLLRSGDELALKQFLSDPPKLMNCSFINLVKTIPGQPHCFSCQNH